MTETLRSRYKKPCARRRKLKEVKSWPVLKREEKLTLKKTKRQCRKYLLVYVEDKGYKNPVT